MAAAIFNGRIEQLGSKVSGWTPLEKGDGSIHDVRRRTEAELFEQLLLFDRITIKVERQNFGLAFLIQNFALKTVREMLERDLLKFLLWTPVLATSTGRRRDDGTMDHSTVFGVPPLVTGNYQPQDVDPEVNIERALGKFQFERSEKRAFKKVALEKYILPDPTIAKEAKDFILNAYTEGN